LLRHALDPEIGRFIPYVPQPYAEADAHAYVARAATEWATGAHRSLAIADAVSRTFLGAIEVRLGDPGSIGYWVAPGARGRGVATRALVLLSRWALTDGGVERLELTTHPENFASQRVAEKAGFVREGVLRSHIRFREGRRDSVLFSLLPSDL
jgi:[ribosomal protein S5]-alanine N-acetyltransferase